LGAGDVFNIVRETLSPDNPLRNAAERNYEEAKRAQPAALVAGLFAAIQETQVEVPIREQCAILLRKCLESADLSDSLWVRLGEAGQADVRRCLLQILEGEPQPQVRRKVADCTQSLGNQIICLLSDQRPANADSWPELMPTLMRLVCDGSKDAGVRADCVWVMKEVACSVWQILVANGDQTLQVLRACLADASQSIRAEAACLLCTLADNIEARAERKPFAPLIPEAMSAIAALAQQPDSKPLKSVLESMQCSTETADFFKDHIASHVLPVVTQIGKAHPDDDCKKAALEVLITYMESKPKMVFSKIPNYVEQVLEVCMLFVMSLDEDVEAWSQNDEEEGDQEEDFYMFGKEGIDRICRCATAAESFPRVCEALKAAIATLFQSGAWQQVVAGISAMCMMAEYIDDEATVEQMVVGIRAQLAASHVRVRYAAWGAIAQFSEDHADIITSDTWAPQLLPEFVKGMDDSCPRVALRCMEAFQHYGESVERDDLEPFLQPLMEKCGVKLQAGPAFQKKSITFVAVIAGQVGDAFAPYYGPLMPHLKTVIHSVLHKVEERTLLGKCFECISLLAKAVGRQGFLADAKIIMEAMIQATQVPNLPSNDPVKEYMMAASERICGVLKEDFLPFVPHILPGVLEKLTFQPRELDTSKESWNEGEEVNLAIVTENGQDKVVIMHSSEMQDLQGALECVLSFVHELGRAYAPFVAQTATALLPIFEFSMGEEIRDLAYETWAELCKSAREDGQTQVVGQLIMEFLNRALPKMEAQEAKADLFALKTRVDGITTCLKKGGPGVLSTEQVQHLCQVSLRLVSESLQRRAEGVQERAAKAAARKAGTVPDEDDEDEEDGEEQSLRVALCEVAGAIMQHHPDHFVAQALGNFVQLIQTLVQAKSSDDRKLALFVTCDFLDHLGARATPYWQHFMPLLLEDVHNEDAEIRQPACYGLSVAAKEPAFASLVPSAAERLAGVVTDARERSKKKKSDKLAQAAADNAISAIIQILLNHNVGDAAAAGQLWNVWLSGLPCQADEEEGARNHKLLLKLLVEERREVIGEGGANVPRLLGILVDVYKTDMADEETSNGIGQLVVRLGEERLKQMAGSFSEKQQKKLMRAAREASS